LRMLATLMIPDSGSARIEGHDVVHERYAVRRRIGVLSDARGLYPRLTARENVRYFGRLHGLRGDVLDARIDRLFAALGATPIAERRAAALSQGERMKVAIARALVHDPHTLLLDEPTNGLDIPTVHGLREVLRRMRDRGVCVIFSSHVLEEVEALCDNVVIVSQGRVVASGDLPAICRQTQCSRLEEAFLTLTGHLNMEVVS